MGVTWSVGLTPSHNIESAVVLSTESASAASLVLRWVDCVVGVALLQPTNTLKYRSNCMTVHESLCEHECVVLLTVVCYIQRYVLNVQSHWCSTKVQQIKLQPTKLPEFSTNNSTKYKHMLSWRIGFSFLVCSLAAVNNKEHQQQCYYSLKRTHSSLDEL